MKEHDLKDSLRAMKKQLNQRSWRCPNEEKIAAYVDRSFDPRARASLEAHIADCDACLEQVSFLTRAANWENAPEIPPRLLARAKALSEKHHHYSPWLQWRWVALAAAAVIVLTGLGIVLSQQWRRPEPARAGETTPPVSPQTQPSTLPKRNPDVIAKSTEPSPVINKSSRPGPTAPLIRGADSNLSPKFIFPTEGAVVRRASLELRWQEVPEAVFYEVSIVSPSGGVIESNRTEQNHVSIPADVKLEAGSKYFASVRAQLRDGRTVRSIVSFRVAD